MKRKIEDYSEVYNHISSLTSPPTEILDESNGESVLKTYEVLLDKSISHLNMLKHKIDDMLHYV